jgi:hypothetical protein
MQSLAVIFRRPGVLIFRRIRRNMHSIKADNPMRKIFTAIAVLVGLHIISLGTLCAVFPVDKHYDNTYGKDTGVESFEFYADGGIAGCFHYRAKVWKDATGCHLYYKDQDGFEKTFVLSKLEYLQCAGLSQEDADELVSYEGSRVMDGITTSVRIKFKGRKEIEIPRKCYDLSRYELPFRNVLEVVRVKKEHLENDYSVKLNSLLSSYLLKYGVPFSSFIYNKYHKETSGTESHYFYYKGLSGRHSTEELTAFERQCINHRFFREDRQTESLDFMTKDSTVVSLNGHKAYMKAKESDGLAYLFIGSETRETVVILSPIPEGISFEEYKQDVCGIFENANNAKDNRYLLGSAVLAETAALFAAAVVTAVVMYCLRDKKAQ